MEKEFAPYEPSLALKELGFDEPCFAWYAETKNLQISPDVYKKWTSKPCNNSNIIIVFNSDCVTAPTFSQAFRWFREKHNLKSCIMFRTSMADNEEYYDWLIKGQEVVYRHFKTYEEAELACLKNLIEIVKQQL
jgi:hypothetical protein